MVYLSREEEAQYMEIIKALSKAYESFYANTREVIIAAGSAAAGLHEPRETVQKKEEEGICEREDRWFGTMLTTLRNAAGLHEPRETAQKKEKLERLRELRWDGEYKKLLEELEAADLLDQKEVYELLYSTALNAVDICIDKKDVAGLREIAEDECFPPKARDRASEWVEILKERNPLQGDGLAVPVPSKLKKPPKAKKGKKLRH